MAQAVFFVTTSHLDEPQGEGGEARIAAYVAAGHVIANHSHGHPSLSRTEADAYLADVDRAEAWLKDRPGHRPWYRFTYLDEGAGDPARRDAVRAGLGRRGLGNGYITADSYDWYLDDLAGAAQRAGRTLDWKSLADVHAGLIVRAVAFADRLARETIGRAPAQMLLLHECGVTAAALAHSVAYLRAAIGSSSPPTKPMPTRSRRSARRPLPRRRPHRRLGQRRRAVRARAWSPSSTTNPRPRLFWQRVLHGRLRCERQNR